jgi:hypothetical protein
VDLLSLGLLTEAVFAGLREDEVGGGDGEGTALLEQKLLLYVHEVLNLGVELEAA